MASLLMIWQLSSQPALPQAAPAGGNDGEVTITAEITDTGDRPAAEFTLEGPDHGAFGADTTVFTVVWDRPENVSIEDAPTVAVEVEIKAVDGSHLDSPINQPVVEHLNQFLPEKEISWQVSMNDSGTEVFTNGTVIILYPLNPKIVTIADSELPPKRVRQTFGVRELVRLAVPGYTHEQIEWSLSEGSEGSLEETNDGKVYRARGSDGVDTVLATLPDLTILEREIRVMPPHSVHVQRRGPVVTQVNFRPHNGSLVQTVLVDIEFRSVSVNFDEIWVEESAAESQLEGYCANVPEAYPDHDKTVQPVPVRFVNERHDFGVRYGNLIVAENIDWSGDQLTMPTHGRPYPLEGGGNWTWNTRWSFKTGESGMVEIENPLTPQVMEVECTMEGNEHKVVYRLGKGGIAIVEGHHMNPNETP